LSLTFSETPCRKWPEFDQVEDKVAKKSGFATGSKLVEFNLPPFSADGISGRNYI